MEEFLTKLNIVSKNNKIRKLERENKAIKEKINKYIHYLKESITEMELEKAKKQKIIEELIEKNKKLMEENHIYKTNFEKIPKLIIKLFCWKKNDVRGYLNGERKKN